MTRSLCQEVTKNWHSIPSNRTTACSGSNVSVDLGIVSLTLGNSGFPLAHSLVRDKELFRQRLLGHAIFLAQGCHKGAKFPFVQFSHGFHLALIVAKGGGFRNRTVRESAVELAKRVASPHSTGHDVGAHCICARVGTCDFHCRGRPPLQVRWEFVGVDLLIDPCRAAAGRGGGMRACRPTVRWRFVGVDLLIDPCRAAAWQGRRHEGMPPYGAVHTKKPTCFLQVGFFCVGVTYLPV